MVSGSNLNRGFGFSNSVAPCGWGSPFCLEPCEVKLSQDFE